MRNWDKIKSNLKRAIVLGYCRASSLERQGFDQAAFIAWQKVFHLESVLNEIEGH